MDDTETGTATLDRFEEAERETLAVFVVEGDDGELSQLTLPATAVPERGRSVDAVFSLTRTDERFELAYRAEETTTRAESAQARFDRLAQRPPTADDDS